MKPLTLTTSAPAPEAVIATVVVVVVDAMVTLVTEVAWGGGVDPAITLTLPSSA